MNHIQFIEYCRSFLIVTRSPLFFNFKIRLVLLVSLLISFTLCAQDAGGLKPVIPRSPNAAALGKFGEMPVNIYNGTASVSVPLYSFRSGDIELPISLEYHTGGIRLKELAGWVGLGWTLNAGGVISRNVINKDDLYAFDNRTNEIIASGFLTKFEDRYSNYDVPPNPRKIYTTNLESFDYSKAQFDIADFEYDIFSFNFCGKSGKFILTRSGVPILEKAADIKIEYFIEDGFHRFKLTDENGFVYYFKAIETSTVSDRPITYVSSWYLTHIDSPLGYAMDFQYDLATSITIQQSVAWSTIGCPDASSGSTSVNGTVSKVCVLKNIVAAGDTVKFSGDNLREDYSTKKITGMKAVVNRAIVKEFDFAYSYFNPDLSQANKTFKRLRLDKVTERIGAERLPPYEFVYNNPEIRREMTFCESNSVDHWGFFNGVENQEMLIPAFSGKVYTGSNLTPQFRSFPGANRSADPAYMKVFSLKEMIYPTGGKTLLTLEANTYNPHQPTNNVDSFDIKDNAVNPTLLWGGRGLKTGQISIEDAVSDISISIGFVCNDKCDQFLNTYGKIYAVVGGITRDIGGTLTTCDGIHSCHAEFTVPSTSMLNWEAYIDNTVNTDFVRIAISVGWKSKIVQISPTEKYLYAGGLRVKKIENIDHKGAIVDAKEYDYHYRISNVGNSVGYSYGKIMSKPSYVRYTFVNRYDVTMGGGAICTSFGRYSANTSPFNQSVGYDQVTEYAVDCSTGERGNGKVVYQFMNDPDMMIPYERPYTNVQRPNTQPSGMIALSIPTNGLQISKKEYKKVSSGYQRLSETSTQYYKDRIKNYYSLRTEIEVDQPLGTAFYYYAYPALTSYRILPRMSTVIQYDQNDSTKYIKTEESFVYNSYHIQPVERSSRSSKGEYRTQYTIYPPDYGALSTVTGGIRNLQSKHIIAVPVEVYTTIQSRYDAEKYVLRGSITTFKTTLPVADQSFAFEPDSPILSSSFNRSDAVANTFAAHNGYRPKVTFHNYDEKGNILSVSKTDDVRLTYLWGYNKRYPIAEIKNAAPTQVFYTSFEEDITNTSATAHNGLKSHNGMYTVTLPSAGTYAISYWTKTGTERWRLNLETITANKTIGADGTLIDDVRLHPSTAQMSTYTYDNMGRMTSATDANQISTFYQYDGFGRLVLIRDKDNNILKQFSYNYFKRD